MKQLTKALTAVLKELDVIDEAIKSAVEMIRINKGTLTNEIIANLAPKGEDRRVYDRILVEQQVNEAVQGSVKKMQEARRICDRLRKVGRNGLEIAKALEKGWKDALKKAIKDTKWYKERFPRQIEKERREKQYERYRMRPDLYYDEWLGGRERSPEDIQLSRSRSSFMPKGLVVFAKALDEINDVIQAANKAIVNLISKYFAKTEDNPLLQASNEAVKGLRRKPIFDALRQQGREDQVRVLETLFGFKSQPGQFIEVGGEAFLAPALQELTNAQAFLADPINAPQEIEDIAAKLKEFRERGDNPPGEEGPGGTPPAGGTDPTGDAPTGEEAPVEQDETEIIVDEQGQSYKGSNPEMTTEDIVNELQRANETGEAGNILEKIKQRKQIQRQKEMLQKQPKWTPEQFEQQKERIGPITKKRIYKAPRKEKQEPAPKQSELQKVLERRNHLLRRKQRYHLARRIASN